MNILGKPFSPWVTEQINARQASLGNSTNLTNSNRIGTRYEKPYKDNVFLYHGYKIWGMTGKMIYAFLHEIKNYHE